MNIWQGIWAGSAPSGRNHLLSVLFVDIYHINLGFKSLMYFLLPLGGSSESGSVRQGSGPKRDQNLSRDPLRTGNPSISTVPRLSQPCRPRMEDHSCCTRMWIYLYTAQGWEHRKPTARTAPPPAPPPCPPVEHESRTILSQSDAWSILQLWSVQSCFWFPAPL